MTLSTKIAELEITIFGVDGKPCASSRVDKCVFRSIKMDIERILFHGLSRGFDVNVRTPVEVEPGEADGKARKVCRYNKGFVVLPLEFGLVFRMNLGGNEGVGINGGT